MSNAERYYSPCARHAGDKNRRTAGDCPDCLSNTRLAALLVAQKEAKKPVRSFLERKHDVDRLAFAADHPRERMYEQHICNDACLAQWRQAAAGW